MPNPPQPPSTPAPSRPRQWLGRALRAPWWSLLPVLGLWAVAVHLLVPPLIRVVHAGRVPWLARLMPARESHPVDGYLAAWQGVGRASVVVGAWIVVLLAALALWRRQLRRPDADPTPVTAPALLLIATWFGLVVGLAEAAYLVARVFYLGQIPNDFLGASQHAVWMSPLAALAIFLPAGLLLATLVAASRGRLGPRAAIGLLAGLAAFAGIMATGRLHGAAAAVLALGVALRFHASLDAGGQPMLRLTRASLASLVGLVVVLGAGVPLLEWWRERAALASAGPRREGAPNVLFIVLDTERAASTSLHGNALPTTPALEALAAGGAQFEWAIAPAPWTLPSHAAMFTGRRTTELGVGWHVPLDRRFPTLAELLSERGYATAGFVANPSYGNELFGLDRGFGRWEDQTVLPGTVIRHSWLLRTMVGSLRDRLGRHQDLGRKTADAVNGAFLRWVDRRDERPFFAFLNYFDAHVPYLPPPPHQLRFTDRPLRYWLDGHSAVDYSAAERAELELAYQSSIAYLDDRIGRLLAALEARGLRERTVVIVTSDHGETFGEGGMMDHGQDLILPLIHVPLVISWPGVIPAGVRIDRPVGLRHLAATVLDLTGAADGRIPGSSLAAYWRPEARIPTASPVVSAEGQVQSLLTAEFHYLRRNDGQERLFAYRQDPKEEHDLAESETHAGVREELRRALEAKLASPP